MSAACSVLERLARGEVGREVGGCAGGVVDMAATCERCGACSRRGRSGALDGYAHGRTQGSRKG